jgi:hypothetical protein
LIIEVLSRVSTRIDAATSEDYTWNWVVFGTYLVVTYVLSLRGVEGLLLDLGGLLAYESKSGDEYLIITLLGKIKGEHSDRCHLLPCAQRTSSGINVKHWISSLIRRHQHQNRTDGPAITDFKGKVMATKILDDLLIEILEELYDENDKLFPMSIQTRDDLGSAYQFFRSLRSSDTRALEVNVSKSDVDVVNGWHTIEAAKGNRPNLFMQQHYAQTELLLKPFLRCTKAM